MREGKELRGKVCATRNVESGRDRVCGPRKRGKAAKVVTAKELGEKVCERQEEPGRRARTRLASRKAGMGR